MHAAAIVALLLAAGDPTSTPSEAPAPAATATAAAGDSSVHEEALATLRDHLKIAVENHECRDEMDHAREILSKDENDLPALKAIAACTVDGSFAGGDYVEKTREVFEQSKILSIVPELLELGHIKELIPIMRDVETKQNKSAADYLNLSAFYEGLGEPEKQVRALEEAMKLDPSDPRPKLILASKKYDAGDRAGARELYREYFYAALTKPSPGRAYLIAYVAALAWPLPSMASLVAACWLLGAVAIRRERTRVAELEGKLQDKRLVGRAIPFVAALLPLILAYRFVGSGKALPFGLLVLMTLALASIIVGPPVYFRARPFLVMGRNALTSVFSARFARYASLIPTGYRVLLALAAVFVMVVIVPTIAWADVRYGLFVLTFFLFFGTIGSLFVTFLRASERLQTTMRWTAVAASMPFLLIFVISKWDDLAIPLFHGRPPTAHSVYDLVGYLLFWSISLFVGLHLAKILADALLEPLRDMMIKVSLIEKGDFKARVNVVSRDEIGALGDAVNRMAEGLAKREQLEKTFRRYHDKTVAEKIMSGEVITSTRMPAVVMFTDIRGFTRMSEKMDPQAVVGVLNEYFEKMVAVIYANGGHIDKFIGDAIMAYWGVPNADPDAARHAIDAALGMREQMVAMNAKFAAQGLPTIGTGFGINAGEVVAGELGSPDRMEYTVIGDVVNTAQRAESNAMAQQILITEPVFKMIAEGIDAEALEPRLVKGRTEPVFFWSVKGWKSGAVVKSA